MRWLGSELEQDTPSLITGEPEINITHFAYAAYLLLLGSGLARLSYFQYPDRYNAMLQQFSRVIEMGFGLK